MSPLLSRWEVDPPAIGEPEARRRLKDVFAILRSGGLVRATTPAGASDCPDCSRRCRVEYITDSAGEQRGYINCGDCGLSKVANEVLQRWEVDTAAILAAIFADVKRAIEPQTPHHLWQVGKANWAGRSRQIWFARAFRRGRCAAAVDILGRNKMAVVFAPTDAGAARWREAAGNLVISLDAVVSINGDRFVLDIDDIEGRIVDAGMGSTSPKKKRPKKRGERLADIESLRDAVIEHLRSARDHAHTTKDQHGEPRLLPRPTQKALGELVGMNETKVSRCLKDEKADELRLYWEMAQDLDQIMKFKGPISGGRRT